MTYDQVSIAFDNLRELVGELYVHEPCGGPLHIITDDGNIEDTHLVSCYRWLHGEKNTAFITSVCKAILHELMLLTEAQRLLWWLEGSIRELKLDPVRLAFEAGAEKAYIVDKSNGSYGARLVGGAKGSTWSWDGLEQTRERMKK